MSIHTLRQISGLAGITMRYEEGGKVQVYKVGDREIKFGPTASDEEIEAAFKVIEGSLEAAVTGEIIPTKSKVAA